MLSILHAYGRVITKLDYHAKYIFTYCTDFYISQFSILTYKHIVLGLFLASYQVSRSAS